MRHSHLRLHEGHDDGDDPTLSLVNLIDIFLVLIAVLLLAVAENPFRSLPGDELTVIRNAGGPDMEVVVKHGEKIERYRADGAAAAGKGIKAGVAYRMADGSLVYVPE